MVAGTATTTIYSLTDEQREYIAVSAVKFFTEPGADANDWTPKMLRDILLNIIPRRVAKIATLRIANELTRWRLGCDEFFRIRWEKPATRVRIMVRVIDGALEKEGAEGDEDITDDMTLMSYPRLYDWARMIYQDMRNAIDEQKRLGTRPKVTYELLLHSAQTSALYADQPA